MPRIIHAADFHIGTKFQFLPADMTAKAVKLQLDAFKSFIQYTAASNADAVFIAGDLFDTPEVRPQIANAVFSALAQCPCPVFISPGNHDYYHAGSPYANGKLPDNVHVFTNRTLEPYPLPDGRTVVWGAAFQDHQAVIPMKADLDPEKVNICVVHGEFGGSNGYNSLTERTIYDSGFDYIALGHNHKFSGVFRIGQTAVSCPGCFSATASNETGVKGYLTGTLDKDTVSLSFHPSEALEFIELPISMSGIPDDQALGKELLAHMPKPPSRIYLTIQLTGTRLYMPNIPALTRSLQANYFHVEVEDSSMASQDPYRYHMEDGLRGAVTRDFIQRIDEADGDEQTIAKLSLALEYAIAALDGKELEE